MNKIKGRKKEKTKKKKKEKRKNKMKDWDGGLGEGLVPSPSGGQGRSPKKVVKPGTMPMWKKKVQPIE
ncbi:MAG: hypothetical protein HQL65_17130 [Magnetococcales bacterium]|nr:hypothetical protein [Magnetococcales bacterium]